MLFFFFAHIILDFLHSVLKIRGQIPYIIWEDICVLVRLVEVCESYSLAKGKSMDFIVIFRDSIT